jgi:hypothetical protein
MVEIARPRAQQDYTCNCATIYKRNRDTAAAVSAVVADDDDAHFACHADMCGT